MSAERRAAISRGRIAQLQRDRAAHPETLPESKRCTQCGEWKRVPQDYTMRKRKRRDGSVNVYPSGECKQCQKKRAHEYRAQKRATGELAEMERRWNQNRDREHRRTYNREYERFRRALAGRPIRGSWRKYRNTDPEARMTVDGGPFLQWLDEYLAVTGLAERTFCEKAAVDPRVIRRIRNEGLPAPLNSLDKLAVAAGVPHLIVALYPLE